MDWWTMGPSNEQWARAQLRWSGIELERYLVRGLPARDLWPMTFDPISWVGRRKERPHNDGQGWRQRDPRGKGMCPPVIFVVFVVFVVYVVFIVFVVFVFFVVFVTCLNIVYQFVSISIILTKLIKTLSTISIPENSFNFIIWNILLFETKTKD